MRKDSIIRIDNTLPYSYTYFKTFKTDQTKAEHALAEFDVFIYEIELRDINTNETIDKVVY